MKRIKATALLLFPLLLAALSSCGETQVPQEDMAHARAFVLAINKGENAYNGLAFKTSLTQRYEVTYVDDNGDATTGYDYDYVAQGSVTMAYKLDDGVPFDFAKAFDEGGAYLAGEQEEIVKLTSSTAYKAKSGKDDRSFQEDYSFHHLFGIQFDPIDFYAQGNHHLIDRMTPTNDASGTFQGHMARRSMEGVASSTIRNSIDRILYMNVWTEVSSFRKAMNDYFASLNLSSDVAASDFVRRHKIAFSKQNGLLHAELSFDAAAAFSAIGDKNADIDARIAGKVDIDESNGRIHGYSFDFKDAYAAMLSKQLSKKKTHTQNVEAFILRGELLDFRYEDMHLSGNFVDYSSDQLSEFVDQYRAHVIPDISGLGR